MRILLPAVALMLVLPGCKAKQEKPAEDVSEAQVTSIEDYDLPADRSDQITSIDAATGDAGGMPRDGGAVVKTAKPEPEPAAAPAPVTVDTIPVITPPPPVVTAPATPSVQTVPGAN